MHTLSKNMATAKEKVQENNVEVTTINLGRFPLETQRLIENLYPFTNLEDLKGLSPEQVKEMADKIPQSVDVILKNQREEEIKHRLQTTAGHFEGFLKWYNDIKDLTERPPGKIRDGMTDILSRISRSTLSQLTGEDCRQGRIILII